MWEGTWAPSKERKNQMKVIDCTIQWCNIASVHNIITSTHLSFAMMKHYHTHPFHNLLYICLMMWTSYTSMVDWTHKRGLIRPWCIRMCMVNLWRRVVELKPTGRWFRMLTMWVSNTTSWVEFTTSIGTNQWVELIPAKMTCKKEMVPKS